MIFVFEMVNCFLDVFFKSPKFTSILHIPQTIPLFGHDHPGPVPVTPEEGMGTFYLGVMCVQSWDF